jgi:hypothetical protein
LEPNLFANLNSITNANSNPNFHSNPITNHLTKPGSVESRWHVFSGNELGVLLGHWQIKKWKETTQESSKRAAVLASVVSSRMIRAVALAEGIEYYDTLTGDMMIDLLRLNLTMFTLLCFLLYHTSMSYDIKTNVTFILSPFSPICFCLKGLNGLETKRFN